MSYFWRKSGGCQNRYQATRQNHSLHSLIPLAELCSRVGRGLPTKRITFPAGGEMAQTYGKYRLSCLPLVLRLINELFGFS